MLRSRVARVRINGGLVAFERTMMRLAKKAQTKGGGGLHMFLIKAITQWSEVCRKLIQEGYMQTSGGHPHGTRLVYRYGKAVGRVNPHRKPFPGAKPGVRSGMLAKSVKLYRRESNDGWNVEIDRSARYTGFSGKGDATDESKRLGPAQIAAQLETPTPRVQHIPMTKRMQVYLMLLYEGKAGEGTKKTNRSIGMNYRVGKNVVIQKRPLPIWAKTYKAMIRSTHGIMEKMVGGQISRVAEEEKAKAGVS